MKPETALDALDWAIVKELQKDGRESFRAIARRLSVSEGAVRSRIRRLKESGQFRFQTLVSPRAAGLNCIAYVDLNVKEAALSDVTSALAAIDEFMYVAITLGRFNVNCLVFANSREDLAAILTEKVMNLPGVVRTETMEVLDIFKFEYTYFD